MNEFENRKREVFEHIYFEAGAALFDCQFFEYDIAILLSLFARFGAKGLDVGNTVSILEGKEKKTAGQLVRLLKAHLKVSEGIENALTDALEARNFLIHRYFVDNMERMAELNEHGNIVKEIMSLRSRIQKVEKLLDPYVKALTEMLEGISIEDISVAAKAKFMLDTKRE